jgi:1-acyl-sn-glycerol-3-phosphate acyltransferase
VSRQLKYFRRWVGTAVSFFLFGLGGLFQGIVLHPLIFLFVANKQRRRALSRRVVGASMALFIRVMALSGVADFNIYGRHNIEPGRNYLIISNHPSLIDIVYLLSVFPNANCVVKASMAKNPLFYFLIKSAGYLSNDDSVSMILNAVETIDAGESLVVFPEGTRTQHGGRPKFDIGAAAIALRSDCECLPIVIECNPTTLTRQDVWYRIPDRKVHFRALIGASFRVSGGASAGKGSRVEARAVTESMESLIVEQMSQLEIKARQTIN